MPWISVMPANHSTIPLAPAEPMCLGIRSDATTGSTHPTTTHPISHALVR